ncbi:MAG: MerR family transcriptional regulator [Planctomycetota bacterium]|jgi:DNA-binding transcriptional MerR regulator
MTTQQLSIGELAAEAGISRRAVRFYVQRGLLEPPEGRGRGSRYTGTHLDRLQRIQSLQEAGHSLESIRRILDGSDAAEVPTGPARGRRPAPLTAELWTRVAVADGVELHVDLGRHQLEAEQVLAIRDAVQAVLAGRPA